MTLLITYITAIISGTLISQWIFTKSILKPQPYITTGIIFIIWLSISSLPLLIGYYCLSIDLYKLIRVTINFSAICFCLIMSVFYFLKNKTTHPNENLKRIILHSLKNTLLTLSCFILCYLVFMVIMPIMLFLIASLFSDEVIML